MEKASSQVGKINTQVSRFIMRQFSFFVGVDIAFASFMAFIGTAPWKVTVKPTKFDNTEDGFVSLSWLVERIQPKA